jgi:hypothetical protein
MSVTKKEIEQMKRLFHSEYGHLQVKPKRNLYSIDEKTAQALAEKGLADYNHVAMTKFCRLTKAGIDVLKERGFRCDPKN